MHRLENKLKRQSEREKITKQIDKSLENKENLDPNQWLLSESSSTSPSQSDSDDRQFETIDTPWDETFHRSKDESGEESDETSETENGTDSGLGSDSESEHTDSLRDYSELSEESEPQSDSEPETHDEPHTLDNSTGLITQLDQIIQQWKTAKNAPTINAAHCKKTEQEQSWKQE